MYMILSELFITDGPLIKVSCSNENVSVPKYTQCIYWTIIIFLTEGSNERALKVQLLGRRGVASLLLSAIV